MSKLVTREDLFELIWQKPITQIAGDFRISDSAVIKMCKKMEIPRPGRGYWAKIEHGKKVSKPNLRKLSRKGQPTYNLTQHQDAERVRADGPNAHPLVFRESTEEFQIVVPDSPEMPHRLTEMNRKSFSSARSDHKGILLSRAKSHFDLRVTKTSLDRALRIMDTLLKAFEKRGWRFNIESEPKLSMSVTVLDEEIPFSIKETVSPVAHVETEKEKRARATGRWVRIPDYDYIATGDLKLGFKAFYYYGHRASWKDGKRQRVEGCLNKFCAGLVLLAEGLKQKRIDDERDRILRNLRSVSYERRRARLQHELTMRFELVKQVQSWNLANDIRAYVAASTHLALLDTNSSESHDKWSQWALNYAASIDPLEGGNAIDLDEMKQSPKPQYSFYSTSYRL